MNPLITDEMVEAAAIALRNQVRERVGLSSLDRLPWSPASDEARADARAALEAAAPLIAAKALRDFAKFVMGPSPHMQDAATCRSIALDAEALARRIERGES